MGHGPQRAISRFDEPPHDEVPDTVAERPFLLAADIAASLAARRGGAKGDLAHTGPLAAEPVPAGPALSGRSLLLLPPTGGHAMPPAQSAAAIANAPQSGPPSHPRWPRWSADGWALVRGGQSGPALAAGAAAYGGSQAGAVLRYNLAPASPIRPQVYVRAAAALAGPVRQSEGALGLMLRPARRVPLAMMGELRVQESGGQARVRPVFTAVSELAPLRLPLGAEAEVYAQAGWAGGRDATAFYDMAATAQRCVTTLAPSTELRLGGGLWSGGQRGAARLDLGPRLELRGRVGSTERPIGVRLAVDWRFRVAGQAEPGSGPALTLAAGF